MLDKARLGNRYTCYECGTKFYDLNRPAPICPECQADQGDAPVQDVKTLLSKGGRGKGARAPKPEPEEDSVATTDDSDEDEDEEGEGELRLGLGEEEQDDDLS